MNLRPIFLDRTGAPLAAQPAGPFSVTQCTWTANGGPGGARLWAPPGSLSPSALADLPGCPVELAGPDGQPAWWGYIHAASAHGGAAVEESLDPLCNRARVDFRYSAASAPSHFFAEDARSQARYGIKETFLDLGVVQRFGQVIDCAGSRLNPLPGRRLLGRHTARPNGFNLELRGWFDTLGWTWNCWQGEGFRDYSPAPLDEISVGASAGAARASQAFDGPLGAPAWAPARLRLNLRKVGAPSDALRVGLYLEGASGPTGAELLGVEVAAAALTPALAWYEFELPGAPVPLAPGQPYCLVFSRTGATNAAHSYRVGVDTPIPVGGMYFARVWNGSAWVQRSPLSVAVHTLWGQARTGDLLAFHAGAGQGGQFLAGVQVSADTGRWARMDGGRPRTHLREVLDLLALGTATGGRLLAQVTPGRGLRVFAAPPRGQPAARVGPGGLLLEAATGRPFPPHRAPAGLWAALPAGEEVFVERVELGEDGWTVL